MAQEYKLLKERLGQKCPTSKACFRPLIQEKNEKIKDLAISSLEKVASNPKYKITTKLVHHIISKTREEVDPPIFKPSFYTVWNFHKFDKHFGTANYPGRIPGQLIQNILYYYTNEDDLVVDPMAGGGTTIDVCKEMKRRCLAYDIAPIRADIKKHDVRDGFPEEARNCKLVFLDPPYWSMKGEKYDWDPLFDASVDSFYDFVGNLAKVSLEGVQENGFVTLLMMNQTDKDLEDQPYIDHAFNCYQIFLKTGFKAHQRVSCPLSTQQYTGYDVKRAKEEKRMLGIVRDLLIFRKETD